MTVQTSVITSQVSHTSARHWEMRTESSFRRFHRSANLNVKLETQKKKTMTSEVYKFGRLVITGHTLGFSYPHS